MKLSLLPIPRTQQLIGPGMHQMTCRWRPNHQLHWGMKVLIKLAKFLRIKNTQVVVIINHQNPFVGYCVGIVTLKVCIYFNLVFQIPGHNSSMCVGGSGVSHTTPSNSQTTAECLRFQLNFDTIHWKVVPAFIG